MYECFGPNSSRCTNLESRGQSPAFCQLWDTHILSSFLSQLAWECPAPEWNTTFPITYCPWPDISNQEIPLSNCESIRRQCWITFITPPSTLKCSENHLFSAVWSCGLRWVWPESVLTQGHQAAGGFLLNEAHSSESFDQANRRWHEGQKSKIVRWLHKENKLSITLWELCYLCVLGLDILDSELEACRVRVEIRQLFVKYSVLPLQVETVFQVHVLKSSFHVLHVKVHTFS